MCYFCSEVQSIVLSNIATISTERPVSYLLPNFCPKPSFRSCPELIPRLQSQASVLDLGPMLQSQTSFPPMLRSQTLVPDVSPRPQPQTSVPDLSLRPRSQTSVPDLGPRPQSQTSVPDFSPRPCAVDMYVPLCTLLLPHINFNLMYPLTPPLAEHV